MRRWRIYEDEIRFSYEVLPCWRKRVGKYNILLNRGLSGSLRNLKPEVIICGGYNYLSSWQALRWAKRNRVPFLLWSESTGSDQRARHAPIELLKRKFVESCDAFVVPGRSAREYLCDFGVPEGKIFVAPNAIDNALFSAASTHIRSRPTELRAQLLLPKRYFLFVGRLVRGKGVFDLIDAYSNLSAALREQIGLVIAGDGPLRAELESRACKISPGMVHFTGFIVRDSLPAYYGLADCLVLPTHSDTWGMVVNEALACGLPVICTTVAGCAADLVRTNGRQVSPSNPFELAKAMEEIASDSSLRATMAAESRKLAQYFSPESCAAGLARASSGHEVYA
jgi:glycosyltransferase involved in cell wall biosynthesis